MWIHILHLVYFRVFLKLSYSSFLAEAKKHKHIVEIKLKHRESSEQFTYTHAFDTHSLTHSLIQPFDLSFFLCVYVWKVSTNYNDLFSQSLRDTILPEFLMLIYVYVNILQTLSTLMISSIFTKFPFHFSTLFVLCLK